MSKKLIIFSAPSGSGKSTIINQLLTKFPELEFSISATSRAPRGEEQDGKEYYFLSSEEFSARAQQDEFVEWEEVYTGTCYGTLKCEMERIWAKGNTIIFDVDVMGGVRLKSIFGSDACSIFVMPPSVEELRRRLVGRATDAMDVIEKRVAKAEAEIAKSPEFDHIIINDILEDAVSATEDVIAKFLSE
ncbi:MAG: guanylate kinase [Rikenellaceae bacterium]